MIEKLIVLEDIDPVIFYGVNNANMQLVKALYPKLRIVARGNVIKVLGDEEEMCAFEENILKLEKYCAEYNQLKEETIIDIIKGNAPQAEKSGNVIVFSVTGKPIIPRSENQQKLVDAFREHDMVFAIGPAGSGKTYTAIALAVRALKNKEIKKIILSRPAVEAGEKLGFLPGDMKEKIDPYLQPLYDALQDMIPAAKLQEYMDQNVIQIAPLAERCRGHPGRGAEHHLRPNQDVPHPHGHEHQDDSNGRYDADRLAHIADLRAGAGTPHIKRSKGNFLYRVEPEGYRQT